MSLNNILPEINPSLTRRWSVAAAECYARKMKCAGCSLLETCKNNHFVIKKIVLALYTRLGEPPDFYLRYYKEPDDLFKTEDYSA